jgi:hypothetical protein
MKSENLDISGAKHEDESGNSVPIFLDKECLLPILTVLAVKIAAMSSFERASRDTVRPEEMIWEYQRKKQGRSSRTK